MHRNEDIFPDPEKFDPSRWLDPATSRVMDKHMVPFGKGSRQCIGMPYAPFLQLSSLPPLPCMGTNFRQRLAYCELYVTLGTIFRQFENMRVDQTGPEDMVFDDYFSAYNPKNARKFHVAAE